MSGTLGGMSKEMHDLIETLCIKYVMPDNGLSYSQIIRGLTRDIASRLQWPGMTIRGVEKHLEAANRVLASKYHWQTYSQAEVQAAQKAGWQEGLRYPLPFPGANGKTQKPNAACTNSNPVIQGPPTQKASAMQSRLIEWLEPGTIAVGFIALFAGKTGIGKSLVALDLIRVMLLRGVIDCVLWIGEDPPEQMTIPRLLGMGIDSDKFSFLTDEAGDVFTLKNLELLESAWVHAGKPKLIVIDPPSNWLGGVDANNDGAVRAVLRPIITWLNQHSVACVMITHTRKKKNGQEREAIDEVIGSIAWGTACRMMTIFVPARDPANPKLSLMTCPKMNLGVIPPTRTFEIVVQNGSPIVQWHNANGQVTADEAINRPVAIRTTRGENAVAWLEERFREQKRWTSDELKTAAKAAGLSKNALWSDEVKALPIKKEQPGHAGPWYWEAIPPWPPIAAGQAGTGSGTTPPLTHPHARENPATFPGGSSGYPPPY
jgi:hypothetical protein